MKELTLTQQNIRAATGQTPRWFRPPYGDTDQEVDSIAEGLGLRSVMWDIEPEDWAGTPAGTVVARIVEGAAPDRVVLLHDGGNLLPNTVQALPMILTALKAQGYTFVTLDELPRWPTGFPGA